MKWHPYSDINVHIRMLADEVRTRAFQRAIEASVRPGMTVLDFGCGTGILAFFAERAGAARVYAVDSSPFIRAAQAIARANRFERIRFIHTDGGDFELPERVDLIVSECLGHYVFQERMVGALFRVRDRHLRPDGKLIPTGVTLWASIAEKPLETSIAYFDEVRYGIDFSPLRPFAYGQHGTVVTDHVAAPAAKMGVLDFLTASQEPKVTSGTVAIRKPTRAYGLVAWFDAALADGIDVRTGPDQPITHWKQSYFPFADPPPVPPGVNLPR